MKKEFGLVLLALFFLSLNAITGAYAVEGDKNSVPVETNIVDKPIVLLKEEMDVSGDGKLDTIVIKGVQYEDGSSFLKGIFLEIKGSNGQTYTTELDSGFDPDLKFVDLNHDGIQEMYITIPTGGSGGIANHFLYTLKDFTLTDIGIPDPLMISSEFQDGYKAAMTIDNTNQTYNFNLMNRKKNYNKLGLYINGKLNEPRELMVDSYSSLKPVIVKDELYGLKGVQQISGAYHADGIAFVESKWIYENGKWTLMETKVIERSKKAKKK
ncbi:hypothetical protein [Niallia endozanthoxylica]|uniref:Uncharacterized protein n=1 Tax=Niallia endozanthoxylica TaxID=2036016 RepID=A0A5J5HTB1_9BACI|nr:hypothetical protein [Niallia endozanthoxylica]KAA9023598.1 hypothetical protein F4V44_13120 [Niallia endozanthoxylica]